MYNIPRWIATTGGVIAALTALALINKDVFDHGSVSFDHVITVPLMMLAIITSHLAIHAWQHRQWISFAPLGLIFALSTALILYSSVGRQAADKLTVAAKEVESKDVRSERKEDIKRARKRLAEAEWMRDWEAAGRPRRRGQPHMKGRTTAKAGCGSRCRQWTQRVHEVQSHLNVLERKLGEIGSAKEVYPQAEKAAQIVKLLGGDKAWWKHLFITIAELAMAVCFELASVILFAVAWAPSSPPGRRLDVPDVPAVEDVNQEGSADVIWVEEFRKRHQSDPSAAQFARAFGCSRTTGWRKLRRLKSATG